MRTSMRKTGLSLATVAALCVLGGIARADVVYDNTSNPADYGIIFRGATSNDLVTSVDLNELTLATGSAGMQVTQISIIALDASNNNAATDMARPTIYIWAADGPGGVPGTLLAYYVLPDTTFVRGSTTTLTVDPLPGTLLVPGNRQIWAGLGYDNDNGASNISVYDLNGLGAPVYHPATVGVDGPIDYFIRPGAGFAVNNPTLSGGNAAPYSANYAWSLMASPVPEPASLVLCGLGVAALASYARRRRAGHSGDSAVACPPYVTTDRAGTSGGDGSRRCRSRRTTTSRGRSVTRRRLIGRIDPHDQL